MNFKEFLFTEEINLDDTATVYHRTKTIDSIQNILKSGFTPGSGAFYGAGLYTTISLESQFDSNMGRYGSYIIKFHVTNLDEYLVFHPNIAKRIHGINYKLSDQLKKFNLIDRFTSEYLNELDRQQEMTGIKDASNLYNFYNQNRWIASQLKGVIYYGVNDGYCLLKYEPVNDRTISILAYAKAEADDKQKMQQLYQNQGWVTETNKIKIKELNRLSQDKRQQYAQITDNSKKINQLIRKAKDSVNIAKFLIQRYKLSDQNVEYLLDSATNKQEMVKIIIQYKPELSDDNVSYLLDYASNAQEIAKLIIQKKPELSDDNVENLLGNASDKQEIAEFIIQKKSKLSDDNVENLIRYATEKQEIAKLIIEKQPELSDDSVYGLLSYANKKQEMAKIIIQYKPELSDNNVYNLLHYAPKKQEIAELIIEKKPKLSEQNVFNLLHYAPKKQEIAELLQKDSDNINKLYDYSVYYLLRFSSLKQEMAKILDSKNISKLSDNNVEYLLRHATNKPEIAQIINQYHTKKTPKIEEMIKPYLNNS